MGYRVLSVLMITFLVTGFGWGKKEDTSSKSNQTSSSYSTASATKASSSYSSNTYNAQSAAVSSGEEQFPTDLISTIASGDEETRRARIESLKRLSQALSDMKKDGGQTTATKTASSASQTSSSNSTYPWGNY